MRPWGMTFCQPIVESQNPISYRQESTLGNCEISSYLQ